MEKIKYFANKPSAVLVREESTFTELNATENGEYTPEGYDGFSKVTVDVFSPTLITLNATENQTYNAPEGKAYNEVVVNVPAPVPVLVTKSITSNGVYTASQDNADGYSSVNVSVSSSDLPTLYAPNLNYGTASRPLACQTGYTSGSYPTGVVFTIDGVSFQLDRGGSYETSWVAWIYDKTPIAGGTFTIRAYNVAPNFNNGPQSLQNVTVPSATQTTGYCSVAGLGNQDPTSQTYTYDADFPRSFQEVQDTYGNRFIKIPTIYRKILTSSNGQITSYALATSALDSDYKPYPCFIDRTNSDAILPYILIGKYLISSTTAANSNGGSPVSMNWTNARTLCRARGTGYQLYDWQMWELFRDLGLIISRYININQGSPIYIVMGIGGLYYTQMIDGIIKGSAEDSQQWYCADNPADYYTPASASEAEATILSHNYTKLSYKCPSTTNGYITKLGYDPDNPFFNQPEEASGGSSSLYYCDQMNYASGVKGIKTLLGAASANSGWFNAYVDDFGYSNYCRLCYRPILNATGYTE